MAGESGAGRGAAGTSGGRGWPEDSSLSFGKDGGGFGGSRRLWQVERAQGEGVTCREKEVGRRARGREAETGTGEEAGEKTRGGLGRNARTLTRPDVLSLCLYINYRGQDAWVSCL